MSFKFLTTLCGFFFVMTIMSSCQKEELSAPGKHDGNIITRTEDCFAITYSQGGYGNGGGPYTYLSTNWDAITPVVIGCGSNTKTYTTALQVQNDLPATGTAGVLGDSRNGGVLRGQVATLVINVKLDDAVGGGQLGDMIITSGPFVGLTVNAFVVIANDVLGGCSNAYTPAQVNTAAEGVNLSWHPGFVPSGFTTCLVECEGLTYSQGGYGGPGEPYIYLSTNWAAIGGTVTIGCGSNTMTFNTPEEVQNDLPAGGTPGVLGDGFNGGSLRGQVLALSLSIKLSDAVGSGMLGDMVITSGLFAGTTVNAFLVIANDVLGGCSNAYSSADVAAAAEGINLSWHPDEFGNIIPTGFTDCVQ